MGYLMKKSSNKFLYILVLFWICVFAALVTQGMHTDRSLNDKNQDSTEERPNNKEEFLEGEVQEQIVDENITEEPQPFDSRTEDVSSTKQQTAEITPQPLASKIENPPAKPNKPLKPKLSRIEIFPKPISTVAPGNSKTFTATGYDDQGNEINFTAKWETNAGSIEKISDNKIRVVVSSNKTTAWLKCTDVKTRMSQDTYIYIKEKPRLESFAINNLPGSLLSGESSEFEIVALDQFGKQFPVDIEWQTPAGTIQHRHFTAGNEHGRHEIIAYDRVSGQRVSHFIHIKPRLAIIDLYGTKKSLRPGEVFQYRAVCYDNRKREIDFPVEWTASGGEVDTDGNLTPGEIPGTYEIFVQGRGTDIRVGMYYKITPIVKSIRITNIPEFIYTGDTYTFTAIGYDYRNRPLEFDAQWQAGGGSIDNNGNFTAGNRPGKYNLVVSDGYGVEHRASFVVKQEVTEKSFNLARRTLRIQGKNIVRLHGIEVTIYKSGSYSVSYEAQIFENESWSYELQFHLERGGSFSISLPSVNRSPGFSNFTQRGRSNNIRQSFRQIEDVSGDFD